MSHPGSTKPRGTTPRRTHRSRPGRPDIANTRPRPSTVAEPLDRRPRGILAALDARPATDEELHELWTMTPAERAEAMYGRRLSLPQLIAWGRRRPEEVPLIGGEFAWLVMRDPVWCEPTPRSEGNQ